GNVTVPAVTILSPDVVHDGHLTVVVCPPDTNTASSASTRRTCVTVPAGTGLDPMSCAVATASRRFKRLLPENTVVHPPSSFAGVVSFCRPLVVVSPATWMLTSLTVISRCCALVEPLETGVARGSAEKRTSTFELLPHPVANIVAAANPAPIAKRIIN